MRRIRGPRAFAPRLRRQLLRAAAELQLESTGMGVGALTLPRLIAWAHKDRFGLAIGFYPETGAVRYQSIDIAGVDALAKR